MIIIQAKIVAGLHRSYGFMDLKNQSDPTSSTIIPRHRVHADEVVPPDGSKRSREPGTTPPRVFKSVRLEEKPPMVDMILSWIANKSGINIFSVVLEAGHLNWSCFSRDYPLFAAFVACQLCQYPHSIDLSFDYQTVDIVGLLDAWQREEGPVKPEQEKLLSSALFKDSLMHQFLHAPDKARWITRLSKSLLAEMTKIIQPSRAQTIASITAYWAILNGDIDPAIRLANTYFGVPSTVYKKCPQTKLISAVGFYFGKRHREHKVYLLGILTHVLRLQGANMVPAGVNTALKLIDPSKKRAKTMPLPNPPASTEINESRSNLVRLLDEVTTPIFVRTFQGFKVFRPTEYNMLELSDTLHKTHPDWFSEPPKPATELEAFSGVYSDVRHIESPDGELGIKSAKKVEDIFRLVREYLIMRYLQDMGLGHWPVLYLSGQDEDICLVYTWQPGATLASIKKSTNQPLDADTVFAVLPQLFTQLIPVTRAGVQQSDLNLHNILLSQHQLTIFDFGLSAVIGEQRVNGSKSTLQHRHCTTYPAEFDIRSGIPVNPHSNGAFVGLLILEILNEVTLPQQTKNDLAQLGFQMARYCVRERLPISDAFTQFNHIRDAYYATITNTGPTNVAGGAGDKEHHMQPARHPTRRLHRSGHR